jgi:hypothetical protein
MNLSAVLSMVCCDGTPAVPANSELPRTAMADALTQHTHTLTPHKSAPN